MYDKKSADFFKLKINEFVKDQLYGCTPQLSSDKTIHDPIWGSVLYYSWEIQLIDTPLFQRLRGINQLGMANLTYPAAHHTRYEHSLGTAAIAARMIGKLRERHTNEEKTPEFEISASDIYIIRLAALLHDIGHCVYSHLSEQIYKNMPEFKNIEKYVIETCGQNIRPKPHEIFSYLILTSSEFCSFFHKYIRYPKKGSMASCRKLLNETANMVIGVDNFAKSGGKLICRSFMTDIINSDFDADKLDYTQRDSYTSGIALTYGVERFLMKLVIARQETPDYTDFRLAITADALTTVEELIFNRKILYVYMYRHQKVISTESVVKDILFGIVKLGFIKHPCDFLYLTDSDVDKYSSLDQIPFPELAPGRKMSDFKKVIKNRATPKRCLTLSKQNTKLGDNSYFDGKISSLLDKLSKSNDINYKKELLIDFGENYEGISPENVLIEKINKYFGRLGNSDLEVSINIRMQFYEILCNLYKENGKSINFDVFDLHIALFTIQKDTTVLPVMESKGNTYGTDYIPYVKKWSDAFSWDKWKSYFYASPHVDMELAKKAALYFIKDFAEELDISED